ncbi:unnamed protein product [Durusdinium trenchii]|uniref:FAS-associated factor 2-B (UBX domain-containing protein 8-B) n=2 Tax=Durusdinium trenchii TaxID=1381693 RepID=A0ABP0QQ33_9DINO
MSEEEKVHQLVEVVGIDEEAARNLLEASQWNVEEALHLFFAEGQQVPSFSSREGEEPLLQDSFTGFTAHLGGVIPVAGAQRTQRAPRAAGANGYAAAARTPSEVPAQPQDKSFLGTMSKVWTTAHQALLGVASEDFEQWFQDRYGPPTPVFVKVTFGDAVQEALGQRRLLMAWFHQEDNAASQKFCREVLQTRWVLDRLEEDLLLWAGDVSRFEPSQVARLLGLQRFPALVLLQPVANDVNYHANVDFHCVEWPLGTFCVPLHSCQFSMGADGSTVDPEMVIAMVETTAQDFREEVQHVQEEMQRRDVQLAEDRRLREQQDREYEEALLADQLAALRRAEDSSLPNDAGPSQVDEKSQKAEEKEKAAKEAEEAQERAEEAQRQKRKDEILAQPEPPASSATARIRLQLPSGERLQRTFAATVCLSEVYEWAHCCRPVAAPKHFELCINFPARSLKDSSKTLKELDLVPSAALILKESEPDGESG